MPPHILPAMAAATSSFLTHVNATHNCDLTDDKYISAAVNEISGEPKEYLRQLNWEKLVHLWPSVAVVSLLILLGVPGNALVFLTFWKYFKPTSTRVFILSMAVCDLFTSMLSSPCYVIQTRFLYDLANTYFCRSTFVIHRLPVITSGWLLVAVALDRHHRVCRPFNRQLNPRQALGLVLSALVLACAATLPFIPLHGEITVSTRRPGLCVQWCGVTPRYSAHRAAEWWILILSFTIGFLLLVSSYLHIGYRLYNHRSRTQANLPAESKVQTGDENRHNPAPFGDEDENADRNGGNDSGDTVSKDGWKFAYEGNTTSTAIAESQRHLAQLTSSPVAETPASSLENGVANGASVDSCHKQSADVSNVSRHRVGKKIPTRTTLIMFVLTVAAIVTYLPFVVLSFVSGVSVDISTYCLGMNRWRMNCCMIALYFINVSSVVNPFIYSFCNPAFRHECRRLFVALRTSVATSGDEERNMRKVRGKSTKAGKSKKVERN